MHGSYDSVSFGRLVAEAVGFFAVAFVALVWLVGTLVGMAGDRRARRARRLRAARARSAAGDHAVPAVVDLPVRIRIPWVGSRDEAAAGSLAHRARRIGVDELQIDDLALWSQRDK